MTDGIKEALGIQSCSVKRKFFSRRNAVYHMCAQQRNGTASEFVYKQYISGSIKNEYETLIKMQGKSVPQVLAKDEKSLCLEYLRGETLLECLEKTELSEQTFEAYIDGLLSFLEKFYTTVPGLIYGDVNLRNFIMTPGGLCGVDMEESCPGSIAADIGRAAAFILRYRPEGTQYKIKTAEYLTRRSSVFFGIPVQEIEHEKQAELAAMQKRRQHTGEANGKS